MGQGFGRYASDAPAGHGSRGLIERAASAGAVPAVKQYRSLSVRRGQLQAARRGLVRSFYLGDDAGERASAKAVLCYRQDVRIGAALCIVDPVRAKPHLFEARRIKIKARDRPDDGHARRCCKSSGYARCKQSGRGVVTQALGGGRDFVKTSAVQPLVGEPFVKRGYPERQHRPMRRAVLREFGPQSGQAIGTGPIQRRRYQGHGIALTRMFPLCSVRSRRSSSGMNRLSHDEAA